MTAALLSWLKAHSRTVVNDRDALRLELSKVEQYCTLNAAGIKTPKTLVVNSLGMVKETAIKLNKLPFIVKPNRGGKGTG